MKLLKEIWKTLSKPATALSLGAISISAFIMGIVFWGGFNTALEATNSEQFCISCHSMKYNHEELQNTIHASNTSGVTATCSDCHVPHNWTQKIGRKIEASSDVWGWIFGTVNTREKFENHRLEMASREWARFERDKSAACKGCHDYKKMDWDNMSKLAQKQMKKAALTDQSCVDCHKGIAHHLPELGEARAPQLIAEVGTGPSSLNVSENYFSSLTKPIFIDDKGSEEIGMLNVATKVEIVESEDARSKVKVDGWRKRVGVGRVIYADFGVNILSAQLSKTAAQDDGVLKVFESKVDELTGLTWDRVVAEFWVENDYFLEDVEPLWAYARTTFRTSCSVCHTQPEESHFDANTWPGMFQGMIAFVNMDDDTQALVQKYLQKHSSTYSEDNHH